MIGCVRLCDGLSARVMTSLRDTLQGVRDGPDFADVNVGCPIE